MSDCLDINEIVASNPRVDRDRVKRTTSLLTRLQTLGVTRKEYDLAPRYGTHRIFSRGRIRLDLIPSKGYRAPVDE